MQPRSRIHADPPLYSDQFDRIPDSLILIIFNKLSDVRSLGRCASVSKRFNSLVPLVHDVYVKIDRVVSIDDDEEDDLSSSLKSHSLFSHLFRVMLLTLMKPFHNLRNNNNNTNKPLFPQLSHHTPTQVLKNFNHIRHLKIELPAGDIGTKDDVILKWKAEFGSTLQNCVIFGGTQVREKPLPEQVEDNGSIPESFYTNGGLKLRVVWTISSLIAASTRHCLLWPIIKDHPTLKTLILTDADGQGTLSMGYEQLKEFREKPLVPSASPHRTQVPPSNMKLRYSPYLELPEGMIMQGATLVTIRPSSEGSGSNRKETETFAFGAFDGPFKMGVKALAKRRTYLLEMNGF